MLMLFWRLLSVESEGQELAFVLYMKCVAFLDEADEALMVLCLQRAAADSAEYRHTGENRKKV